MQKSREALLLLLFVLNLECVVLFCVLFLAVDGLDVAVDSANCVQIVGVVLIATLCWYHASDFVGRFSCVMFCNDVLVS